MEQKHSIVLISALLALLAVSPAIALTPNSPDLSASLLYYEPVPALPGTLLDLYVQVSNNGSTAQRVSVEFVDNFPFSIDTEADRIKQTGSIPAKEQFLVKYQVRVSERAVPGTNYVKVQYYSGDKSVAQTALLPVDVFAPTAGVALDDFTIEPETLVPGSPGVVRFTVRNLAALQLADGTVRLDLSDVDIIPAGTTNQQRFSSMEAGGSREFSFRLVPAPELEPGIYKVPVVINYTDQRGNKYQAEETLGLIVGSTPDVTLSVEESMLTQETPSGEVILRITNKGLGEVKFVNLALQESAEYQILSGGDEFYVGNIDSDDYKTARVQLRRMGEGDTISIPVVMTYADALNNQYSREESLTLRLPEGEGGGMGAGAAVALIAVLLIAGYFVFRRKRK